MKVTVFGAGAIGSLLGALLSRTQDVTLVARPPHVEAIGRRGLAVDGVARFVARVRAVPSLAGEGAPDLLLLSVKTYDLEAALAQAAPAVQRGTIVLTIQNGLGSWEKATAAFPGAAVLAATVTYGAALEGPGKVRWNGEGEVVVGGRPQNATSMKRVVDALRGAGLRARPTDDVQAALWLKAIVNASINPLTAIHRVPNGRLLEDPDLRAQVRRLALEGAQVAAANGIRLEASDVGGVVESVAAATAENRSSMLQSLERGRPLELDAITGELLRAAARANVRAPAHQEVYDRLKVRTPSR